MICFFSLKFCFTIDILNTFFFFSGQVGGNQHSYRGGGVNYLCLPNDPQNGQHQSYDNDQVHGGEYRLDAKTKPSGWSESMGDKEIPCAVCYQKRRSAVIMIPGKMSKTISKMKIIFKCNCRYFDTDIISKAQYKYFVLNFRTNSFLTQSYVLT